MKKLLLSLIFLPALAHGEANISRSPFIILYTSNTFQNVETFKSSVTFVDGRMMINGVAYTWPGSLTAGNCLQTDGSGNLSWATCGSGGGGGGGGGLTYYNGSGFVAVSTESFPGVKTASLSGHTTYFIFDSTPTWTGSLTVKSTSTFDQTLTISSSVFFRSGHLVVGLGDYLNELSTGIYLTANAAPSVGQNETSKLLKFYATKATSGGVQATSSMTVLLNMDGTTNADLDNSSLIFSNVNSQRIMAIGNYGLRIRPQSGTMQNANKPQESPLLSMGNFNFGGRSSSFTVTFDGKTGIGYEAPTAFLEFGDGIAHSSFNVMNVITSTTGALLAGATIQGTLNVEGDMKTGGVQYTTLMSTLQAAIDRLSLSTTIVSLAESPDISERTYFVRDESTGFASNYRLLSSSPSVAAETTRSAAAITSANGLVRISSHITPTNDPGIRLLPAGVWSFTSWVNASIVNGVTQLIVTISTVDDNGQGEVVSSTSSDIDDTGSELLDMVAVQTKDISVSTSTRLLVQYFARTTSALGVTVNLFYGGTSRFTHLTSPIGAVYKFVQLADTPSTLQGQAGKLLSVNDDQTSTVFTSSVTNLTVILATMTNLNISSSAVLPTSSGTVPAVLGSTGTILRDGLTDSLKFRGQVDTGFIPFTVFWATSTVDTIDDDTFGATETVFKNSSYTFQANSFTPNKSYRISVGLQTVAGVGPPTLTLRVRLGSISGTLVYQSATFTPTAGVTRSFGWEMHIISGSPIGTNATILTSPYAAFGSNMANQQAANNTLTSYTAQPLFVTAQWSANAANTHNVTLVYLSVKQEN